jgi:hypothetical protein
VEELVQVHGPVYLRILFAWGDARNGGGE